MRFKRKQERSGSRAVSVEDLHHDQKLIEVIDSSFFRLTVSIEILSVDQEHRRSDARPEEILSPTSAIQGSASVLGVHACSSGSPKDYVEPTYAQA